VNCIFCDILEGKKPGYYIYEDDQHVAILDRYPIDVGHSLVLPRDHHEKIIDMNTQSVGNLFSLVPRVAKAILLATGADAFSIAQNNGRAAKQIIPHVHVHLVPRESSDSAGAIHSMFASTCDLSDLQLDEIYKKLTI